MARIWKSLKRRVLKESANNNKKTRKKKRENETEYSHSLFFSLLIIINGSDFDIFIFGWWWWGWKNQMAKTGVLSSDPTVRARAAELKKELQRLVRSIIDDEDFSIHTIDQAKDTLCSLIELKFNKRSTATTTTSSLKLYETLSCPEEFRCPLSKELMRDPVILASGQVKLLFL